MTYVSPSVKIAEPKILNNTAGAEGLQQSINSYKKLGVVGVTVGVTVGVGVEVGLFGNIGELVGVIVGVIVLVGV
jgi:hypothetical protein